MFEIPTILAASTGTVLVLGFLLGLKHAVESDHLAAVSTIVAERKNLLSSTIVGGLWGLGHTISLVAAGILVLLFNFQIGERTEQFLEFCVGVMLVILGLNVLRKILRGGTLHFHRHKHGEHVHAHFHVHELGREDGPHTHHGLAFNPRALIIGMVHGLAGSAALMLLVIPTIESRLVGLLYIVIFGVGSIGGMMIMSFLMSLPLYFTAFRFSRVNLALQLVASVLSVGLGLSIVYEKGFTENLFALVENFIFI